MPNDAPLAGTVFTVGRLSVSTNPEMLVTVVPAVMPEPVTAEPTTTPAGSEVKVSVVAPVTAAALLLATTAAPLIVVTPAPELLTTTATFPPPEPLVMAPFSVTLPVELEPTVIVCVPEVAAPVTAPMVRRPELELEKLKVVFPEFKITGVLTVLAAVLLAKIPLAAPVPPMVSDVPLDTVAATPRGVPEMPKLKLLPTTAPETVIVPVVPPVMFRSSLERGTADKVPPGPPTELVFQKLLVPFQAPVMVLNPAVLPFTSQ